MHALFDNIFACISTVIHIHCQGITNIVTALEILSTVQSKTFKVLDSSIST